MNEDPKIAKLLEHMEERLPSSKSVDIALWHLLKRHEEKLPALDGYFHKAFRQTDVCGTAHDDMAIWHLLQSSNLFWSVFQQLTTELSDA